MIVYFSYARAKIQVFWMLVIVRVTRFKWYSEFYPKRVTHNYFFLLKREVYCYFKLRQCRYKGNILYQNTWDFFIIIRLPPEFLSVSGMTEQWCASTLGASLLCSSRAGSDLGLISTLVWGLCQLGSSSQVGTHCGWGNSLGWFPWILEPMCQMAPLTHGTYRT